MKKIFPSIIICCLLLAVQSCSKQAMDDFDNPSTPSVTAGRTIDATVAAGEIYTYSTGGSESIRIQRQASHFEFSKVDSKNSSAEYQYKPTAGYEGADEVSLLLESAGSSYDNNGGCGNHSSNKNSIVIIKLAVIK